MAYSTPADIKKRYDVRRLGDLVRDDNTRATASDLDSDVNLQMALDDSQGLIDSACLAGRRYTQADLAALTGTSKALLLRLSCDLAYGFLVMRRGYTEAEAASLAPGFKLALQLIDRLRSGELVFNIEANLNAGLPDIATIGKDITLISSFHRLFGNINYQGPE